MEDERIETIKNWPEQKSVRDIQIFISFANFYWQFIWGFSGIAAPLTSILKMTGLLDSSPRDDDNKIVGVGRDRNLSKSKMLKNTKSEIQTRIKATGKSMFPTFGAKRVFNQLRQAFTKVPIFQHFDLKCQI